MEAPTCKKDLQKFLGKVNFLRKFISNLSEKIDAFTLILRLKDEAEFTWGAEQQEAFEKIKKYLSSPPVLKAPKRPNRRSILSHMWADGLLMQKRGIF